MTLADPAASRPGAPPDAEQATRFLNTELPLSFIENRGQWDIPARFVLRQGSTMVRLEDDAILLQLDGEPNGETTLRACLVRMAFEGSTGKSKLTGESRQEGLYNYYIGNRPEKWRTRVPAFDSVHYDNLYSGIDLRVHSDRGLFEYDLILAPGADPSRVRVRCDGVEALSLQGNALLLETEIGIVRQLPPLAWIEENGRREPVEVRFVLHEEDRFGFEVPTWDGARPLVIDPQIDWSTFLGSSKQEFARVVAINEYRSVVVAGETASLDFVSTPGAVDRHPGGKSEAFITVLNAAGTHVRFSTFLGGSAAEIVSDLLVDFDNGGVAIVGETVSPDFPTTETAFDRSRDGDLDGFVAKLSAAGDILAYSTYLGGSGEDRIRALALTPSRDVYLVGETTSSDFPVTMGAFETTHQGSRDVFVASLRGSGDGAGDLAFATYLGGEREDMASSLTWTPDAGLVIAGMTHSRDFPVTLDALDTSYGGKGDGFIARIRTDGSDLEYCTFLGGEGNDGVTALTNNPAGSILTTGFTWSSEFPITDGAFQTTRAGGLEVFVACLDLAGNGDADAVWSTYLGGNKLEYSFDIAVDGMGGVTLVGHTVSDDFPVTPDGLSVERQGRRGSDAYCVRLSPDGGTLLFGTYFGSDNIDSASGLALDGPTGVIIVGETVSGRGFPVTLDSYDPTFGGGWDVFVSRLTIPATPGR